MKDNIIAIFVVVAWLAVVGLTVAELGRARADCPCDLCLGDGGY